MGYFHYRNCSRSLEQVKGHAEQRVRTHLCKRYKVRSRWEGYNRFPNKLLYEKSGLFKVRERHSRLDAGRMPCGEGHRKAVCRENRLHRFE